MKISSKDFPKGQNTITFSDGSVARIRFGTTFGTTNGSKPGVPNRCKHLGKKVERDGTVMTIRCGCDGIEREMKYEIYRCDVFSRCVPLFAPNAAQKKLFAESDGIVSDIQLYHLCHGCPQKEVLV